MDTLEAIKLRHSVRSYLDNPIPEDIIQQLQEEINDCNEEGNLNIQLVCNEPKAFESILAHYGKFSNVQNYIALIGEKTNSLDEKMGYFGERIALKAQMLGLNTCWVALTFSKGNTKKKCNINNGEKLVSVLSLGYGENQGVDRKSKSMEDVVIGDGPFPDWFEEGVKMALLAPTAKNQQRFTIGLEDGKVKIKSTGGFCSKIDLGIVKYHFEIGSGKGSFKW
ncbi:MAG: nitroreductase family protein, partial [Anaerotignaceae bacterium]